MKVTYYNHASMSISSSKGFNLITDPWIYGPIYGGSMWQFPVCQIDKKKYFKKDGIYISHTHPDHFCKNTLKKFPKKIPVYIRKYDSMVPLKENLKELGFKNVVEVEHREKIKIDHDFYITLVHDKKTIDSLIICENNNKTFLMQNDCFLDDEEYKWINNNYNIDLAGIFFMGIGPYPGSFVLPWSEKEKEVSQKKKDGFLRAKKTSSLVGAKNIFPCSNDMIWYRRPDLTTLNGALPLDFKKYMSKKSKKTNVILINSGDIVDTKNIKVKRVNNNDYFKNKHDQLNAYFKIYNNKKIKNHIRKVQIWEDSFKFDYNKFKRHFSMYLKNAPKKKSFRNFKVGLRIDDRDISKYFVIKIDKSGSMTLKNTHKLSELYSSSNMVIQTKGNLIEMAMQGHYTFEDLYNCNYLIDRFNNKYSQNETYFWDLMTEFSWYLENKKLCKNNNNTFLSKQILTSKM